LWLKGPADRLHYLNRNLNHLTTQVFVDAARFVKTVQFCGPESRLGTTTKSSGTRTFANTLSVPLDTLRGK
jgi:hypothetical protein